MPQKSGGEFRRSPVFCLLIGSLSATLIAVLFLLLISLMTLKREDPASGLLWLSKLPLFFGCLGGGLLTALLQPRPRKISLSLVCGGILLLLQILLSLVFGEGKPDLLSCLWQGAVMLLCSVLGGLPLCRKTASRVPSARRRAAQARRHYR